MYYPNRDKSFYEMSKKNDIVILSSNVAKNDFEKYYSNYKSKAEVLQFVPSFEIKQESQTEKFVYIQKKYEINSAFFYLPNQYWKHKNHKIVLEALTLLKRSGKKVLVISTGNTQDYRNPKYFDELKKYILDNKLEDMYRILGLVSFTDVQTLAETCLAYINPSLFEGWSTTVEEAKSREKKIILSNIPVHLEQNPKFGEFFPPQNAEVLAKKMWMIWSSPPQKSDYEKMKLINENRKKEFSDNYCKIIEKLMKD